MKNFELPYTQYLKQGRAWSPTWTVDERGGFDRWLVLAPPEVETIDTSADYFALLARRIEYQLEDWLDRYADELPVRVDPDDPVAVKEGTVEMIRQYVPDEIGFGLRASQSNRSIAQSIAKPTLSPKLILPAFPIALPPKSADDDFGYCITSESPLDGWLLAIRP